MADNVDRIAAKLGAAVVLLNPGENQTVTVPYPRG